MDVEELRIGCHVEDGLQRRCRVDQLTPLTVGCDYGDDWAEIICDKVYPISLSPELLSEIGFKYHEYDNGKLWELDFPDLYKAYMYLEYDEDTTHRYKFRMWNMKEVEVEGAVEYLHELENWIYLIYSKELIKRLTICK